MNKDHRNDIIKYRIERSEETYQEAILMNRENHWNACANRLYQALQMVGSVALHPHLIGFVHKKRPIMPFKPC